MNIRLSASTQLPSDVVFFCPEADKVTRAFESVVYSLHVVRRTKRGSIPLGQF
jgi:hypothetical protein